MIWSKKKQVVFFCGTVYSNFFLSDLDILRLKLIFPSQEQSQQIGQLIDNPQIWEKLYRAATDLYPEISGEMKHLFFLRT